MTLVIILPPVINNFPSMNDITEPVLIQTFIAKLSVKNLNKSLLRQLARDAYSWIKRNSTPCSKAHCASARQVNSGPWSVLIVAG